MQLTVLGQTSEQLVNVAPNLLVDVTLGPNLPLVDALYNLDMKPALAMLTCLRSQLRHSCKTSKSYLEVDEDLEELSSNSDEGDSDEGEVVLPPIHTAAEEGQEAPADSEKKDDTTNDAYADRRTLAESGVRQMHVVESDPEKQINAEASWAMPAEAMDGFNFHDDIFKRYSERQRFTRSKTREDRRTRSQEWSFPLSDPGEPEKLQQAQCQDDSIRSCFNQCTGINPSFFIQNSLLYRRWTPSKREKPLSQLVLPQQYTEHVLRLDHYAPSAGHLWRKKTLSRIQRRYFWPGISRNVADHCDRCKTCQLTSRREPPLAPLIPLPVMDVPMERIAMDMVGPLQKTDSGNRFLLMVVDYGTRFPFVVPLKTTGSEQVTSVLMSIFSMVGIPGEILTDRGSNFTGELMQHFNKMLGIRAFRTSPNHPQTDGMVEQFNSTMKQ